MKFQIAIHPDNYTSHNAPARNDAASPRWAEHLQRAGHEVKWVDVRRADILEQLKGCHGFMWRWAHFSGMSRIARRLLPICENYLGLTVYPDQNTCWHYDDKIAQGYLLPTIGIPIPKTWVWFNQADAQEWIKQTSFPLVLKLAIGAGSNNVHRIETSEEASLWVHELFRQRFTILTEEQMRPLTWRRRVRKSLSLLWRGRVADLYDDGYEPQSGYAFFQEYLPNNEYDTRVTVIGNRAFAFRRFNRPNDFRASGSGLIDWDPASIDLRFVRLAFQTAYALQTQSCAIDGLYRNDQCVVGEISYTYVSWAVQACPGHWQLNGTPHEGILEWIPGQMWPEEAQIQDFLIRLNRAYLATSET